MSWRAPDSRLGMRAPLYHLSRRARDIRAPRKWAREEGDGAGRRGYTRGVNQCFFASDLHGRVDRYDKLFAAIEREIPYAVFLGGDLLPHGFAPLSSGDPGYRNFIEDFVAPGLERLQSRLRERYPYVFVILGNDDAKPEESSVIEIAARGLWIYAHGRRFDLESVTVYGYACVPPTPFMRKDWERYDVSRYVPPGCVSPEEGRLLAAPSAARAREVRFTTIQDDLDRLVGDADVRNAVFLFHAPPYDTALDRVPHDGKMVDHVPMDLHVGSLAVRRFIEKRQPLLTLHGHIHESARLTGAWCDRIGRTMMLNAAHDGPELALVRFDLHDPSRAERVLI